MLAQFLLLFWVWSMFLPGSSPKQQLVIKPMPLSWEALEPITWSVHLPYILESTFARIFLFLETAGLLDSRTLYAIQYNIMEYNTAHHNSTQHIMHYTVCFLGNLN